MPDTVDAPNPIASVSTIVTLLPLVITNVLKSFPLLSNVILLLDPAANVAVLPLPSTEIYDTMVELGLIDDVTVKKNKDKTFHIEKNSDKY